ncbi:MAG: acyltransferase [Gemmatimonadetes bacterium]|nr:acyltransferase [Gemmatimonadota bacterium]
MPDSTFTYPRRGTRFGHALARWLLSLGGWRVEGALPDEPRFVLIVAPHTSNWDFLVGILAMFAIGLRCSWLGKHTLFRFPAGPIMRWMGGEPVDRSTNKGTVETAVDLFRQREQWVLTLTPEGTRKRVDQWKTGFYKIAVGAGVPIVPVTFDYRRKVVGLGAPFRPTGDSVKDIPAIRGRFRKEMAKYPEQFAE